MTSSRSLRMLFSVSLLLVVFIPLAIASQPESNPVNDHATVSAAPQAQPAAPADATARCGRCGDGQCVKSCGETSVSCPIDCGGGPGEPSAAGAQPASCAEEK